VRQIGLGIVDEVHVSGLEIEQVEAALQRHDRALAIPTQRHGADLLGHVPGAQFPAIGRHAEDASVEAVEPVEALLPGVPEGAFPSVVFTSSKISIRIVGVLASIGEAGFGHAAHAQSVNREEHPGLELPRRHAADRPRHRGHVGDIEVRAAEDEGSRTFHGKLDHAVQHPVRREAQQPAAIDLAAPYPALATGPLREGESLPCCHDRHPVAARLTLYTLPGLM